MVTLYCGLIDYLLNFKVRFLLLKTLFLNKNFSDGSITEHFTRVVALLLFKTRRSVKNNFVRVQLFFISFHLIFFFILKNIYIEKNDANKSYTLKKKINEIKMILEHKKWKALMGFHNFIL